MSSSRGARTGLLTRTAVAVASLSLLAAACGNNGSDNDPGTGGNGDSRFRTAKVTFITSSRSVANQMVFTADEGGFLEDYGIDAEIVVAETSTAATAALLSGDAHFMTGSRSEAALAQAGGQDVRYLLKHSAGFSSQVAVSKKIMDSLGPDAASKPLAERLKALEGKSVALPSEGSVLTVVFDDAMKGAGLSYKPTYIGGDTMPAALARGSVDAYFFPPPTPQSTVKAGQGGVLIEGSELPLSGGPSAIQAPLYVTKKYLDGNRDIVVRVAAAFRDAAEFHRDKQDEAKKLVKSRFAEMDQQVFELMWESIKDIYVTPIASPLTEADVKFILDNDLKNDPRAKNLVAADIMVPQDVRDEALRLAAEVGGS